ncbi:MAG: YajQ family cyclic di-GMP-binding protein [Rhodospirillaceae bacterium]|nr:YajQ family cyclic di-GMP-binding protein [Alphaproteobacteria bacterium]MBR71424.1 YajQ family cyclic di-GMP-binding protein [Rhodospirillaceae bacterium]|tara:strand:- start:8082 stop:8570 length:489 start_codon:yes stop_codon:yes gene_type:complete
MPTFDIVSRVQLPEVDNAIQSAMREINQRYDFKGSQCSIERTDNTLLVIKADDDYKLKQVHELFRGHLAKRKVSSGFFEFGKAEDATGGTLRQQVKIVSGIERDLAQKIIKQIKNSKIKVQSSIQGDELRVAGKKRDNLQEAIQVVKDMNIVQPLQYLNFRD